MRLFDTHAHYTAGAFNADRSALLSGLPEQGVKLLVCPGDSMESSRYAVELSNRYPHVYAAIGIHPENCEFWSDDSAATLEALAANPKVVAIGEIGLDYYWKSGPPREVQQNVFRRQLELAQRLGLPTIVHDREAHGDSLAIVKEFPNLRGVFHCYSGALEMAKELVKLGWSLSFTGNITYAGAKKALEVIQWLPMDRIMVETDSPYLPPVPYRGQRNDSAKVRLVVEKIAEIKALPPEEVAEQTYQNGLAFFGIEARG